MAASSRADRALMRVRGAGSRQIPTVDFGLKFAFGNKKQENQHVPTPARSLRSNTKTPQSVRAASRRTSNATSARRSREPSSARSVRQVSTPRDQPGIVVEVPAVPSSQGGAQSSKRRRISPEVSTPVPGALHENPNSTRSTRASKRRENTQIFPIAEDDETGKPNIEPPDTEQPPTSPLFVPEDEPNKENQTPDGLDRRLSIAHDPNLQTTKSGRILIDTSTLSEDVGTDDDAPASNNDTTLPSILESPSVQELDIPSKSNRVTRKRLPSSDLRTTRPRSSTSHQSALTLRETPAALDSSPSASQEPTSVTTMPLVDRISKYSKIAQMSKNKRQAHTLERQQTPNEAEDSDESYVEGSPEAETPAVSRQVSRKVSKQTRKSRPQSSGVEGSENNTGKSGKSTFPILTHRLTNISTLPVINENEHEDEGTPFEETSANRSAERSQPNVVDVLAQICREIVSNMIESVDQTASASTKAASKNKRTALDAFGKDLEDELFTISEALENSISLEARARKSKREKAALQAEYMELRKQREQIALKCDLVRRQHWECEEDTRQKWTLSQAARSVERCIARNEVIEDEGIEFLLKSVTDTVSSASGQGGSLDKVKSFNAQLENMALLLERKDARPLG